MCKHHGRFLQHVSRKKYDYNQYRHTLSDSRNASTWQCQQQCQRWQRHSDVTMSRLRSVLTSIRELPSAVKSIEHWHVYVYFSKATVYSQAYRRSWAYAGLYTQPRFAKSSVLRHVHREPKNYARITFARTAPNASRFCAIVCCCDHKQ